MPGLSMIRETTVRRRSAVGASALVAVLAGARPTGHLVADLAWSAGLAAALAAMASHAKRGPLLVAAGATALTAGSPLAFAATTAAIASAALSTRKLHRRAPFTRGLAGGMAACSLLAGRSGGSLLLTAAVWAVVVGSVAASGYRHLDRLQRRAVIATASVVGLVVVAACLTAGWGVYDARRQVDAGTSALEGGLAAARDGEVELAATRFQQSRVLLDDARATVERFGLPAAVVPGLAQNVSVLEEVLDRVSDAAGRAAITAAGTTTEDLTVTGGRIDVDAIASLARPLGRLASSLDAVVAAVDDSAGDPVVAPLRQRLDDLAAVAGGAAADASLGAEAAAVVPDVLGASGPRRYLVLFTSPAEARGRFGFPGSYAEVVLDDGRLDLVDHGSVSSDLTGLRPDQGAFPVDDPALTPYVPFGATREFRSVTIPPSWPLVAELAAAQWVAYGRAPVDGVLRFDPAALAALLSFTGPVAVDGVPEPLTAQNLVEFLTLGQYVQFPDEQSPRREVLETVSEVVFERLEAGDLPSPRVLADVFGPVVRAQHLHAAAFEPTEEAFFADEVGMGGALLPPTSDSLLVTNLNSTGNKIDAFLRRAVRYEATVDGGDLRAALTVDLENTAPAGGLPFYVLGSFTDPPLPPGTNRTTLLVYTSVPATSVAVDGVPARFTQAATGGRWLQSLGVELPPGARRTIEVQLEGPLPGEGPYRLELVPGGSRTADPHLVTVDGDADLRFEGQIAEILTLGD